MILEIDNVELYYSGKKILGGVYLKSETSKITGILGRNGSGKSCLLKIIFGNLKPKYGLVRIDSKPVSKSLYKTGIIGYLPQENFLPDTINLQRAFTIYNVNWNEFVSKFLDFKKHQNSKAKYLSQGERRMLETYLILKKDYKIALLDEPFSHLSPIQINNIMELVEEQKQNKAIILTDHMYENVLSVSDSLYLLKNNCTISIKSKNELQDYGYINV